MSMKDAVRSFAGRKSLNAPSPAVATSHPFAVPTAEQFVSNFSNPQMEHLREGLQATAAEQLTAPKVRERTKGERRAAQSKHEEVLAELDGLRSQRPALVDKIGTRKLDGAPDDEIDAMQLSLANLDRRIEIGTAAVAEAGRRRDSADAADEAAVATVSRLAEQVRDLEASIEGVRREAIARWVVEVLATAAPNWRDAETIHTALWKSYLTGAGWRWMSAHQSL